MSCNWGIDDLMGVLRQRLIPYADVRVGDVLVTDHGPQHVARIEKVENFNEHLPGPGFHFFDSWDNSAGGGHLEGKEYATHCHIIDRRALDPERVKDTLQADREMCARAG